MRYQEVVRQYLSVREGSSREWGISESLVMCVELDVSQDTYVTLALAATSSQRRASPQFLRITMFRLSPGDGPGIWAWDASPVTDGEVARLDDVERTTVTALRAVISEWVSGKRDRLPPSTSTAIADRLRRKR